MTDALRLLAAAGAAAVVAALGAGAAAARRPGDGRGARAPVAVALPAPAPGPGAPPAGRESVPPGILSRAADARALDRADCSGTAQDGPACAPQPDPVEIEWEVRGAP